MSGAAQGPRDSFRSYRELLDAYGFTPSRSLGQNFLLDPSLHRSLVDAAAPQADELVLEIGPGLGFLTRELVTRCPVLAVEVDPRLFAVLQQERQDWTGAGGLTLLGLDILQSNRLHPEVLEALQRARAGQPEGSAWLVVANLPYAISGPVLAELACLADPPERMAVLVQLELAERIAARPGPGSYGSLSVLLQSGYQGRILRKVGKQVFRPRPKVDSAMLLLQRRDGGTLAADAAWRRGFARFLREVFAARRKQLRNAPPLRRLAGEPPPELREFLGLRAEQLDPDQLQALYEVCRRGEEESA